MKTESETTVEKKTFLPILTGTAIVLGLVQEGMTVQPAREWAQWADRYAWLHPGLLLLLCGITVLLWNKRLPGYHGPPHPAFGRNHATDAATDASHPALAGSAARARLEQALTEAAAGQAALLVVDIDGFCGLRRTHGNAASEQLLHQFGVLLDDLAPPGAVLACLAADEFILLLPQGDEMTARRVAAHLQSNVSRAFAIGSGSIEVAASVGVSMAPAHGNTAEALLRAGRLAVTLAKADGGQTWRMFDAGQCQAAQDRAALRAELRPALEAGQFVPFYQPIVSLRSGEIVGMEVLARWQHPRRGLVGPDEFIPLMETQRLCAELSLSLLRQVIEDARAWPRAWTFAFNASACQLRELLAFMTDAGRAPDNMMQPRRIELEVTETVLIEDMGLARQVVQAMHRAGAKVVLDDFGTGYANLLPLRDLPFDRIKIDRGFVRDLLVSARTDACLRAMLGLARNLGASVIAEGVESEAAEARLRLMGCDFAQGYFYSPPVPAACVPLLARRMEQRAQSRAVAA